MLSDKVWKKLSEYFNEKGIFLLVNPREKLSPGVVYQTEEDDIHAHQFTKLKVLLTHKTHGDSKEYLLPESEPDSPGDQLEGVLENKTKLDIAVDFAQSLFNKIKAGIGLKVHASYTNKSMGMFQISSISTDRLDFGELKLSVKNFKVRDDFLLNNSTKNYYIVIRTWYSDSIGLLVGSLSQTEIDFYTEAFGTDIGGRFEKAENNMWRLVSKKKVAFGISLAKLEFDRLVNEVILNIVPHDSFKVPFGESDSVSYQDLSEIPDDETSVK
ncbi:MAG TPA: hypothetical protein VH500_04370 [Nitrososphaeraceae archaeon]